MHLFFVLLVFLCGGAIGKRDGDAKGARVFEEIIDSGIGKFAALFDAHEQKMARRMRARGRVTPSPYGRGAGQTWKPKPPVKPPMDDEDYQATATTGPVDLVAILRVLEQMAEVRQREVKVLREHVEQLRQDISYHSYPTINDIASVPEVKPLSKPVEVEHGIVDAPSEEEQVRENARARLEAVKSEGPAVPRSNAPAYGSFLERKQMHEQQELAKQKIIRLPVYFDPAAGRFLVELGKVQKASNNGIFNFNRLNRIPEMRHNYGAVAEDRLNTLFNRAEAEIKFQSHATTASIKTTPCSSNERLTESHCGQLPLRFSIEAILRKDE